MTKKYPSQEMDRFNVRMPAGMRDEITKIAEKNGRSMNTEIVMMLQDGIDKVNGYIKLSTDNSNDKKTMRFRSKIDPKVEREILEEIARLAAENAVKLERDKK
ncbi:protein of unknown function [Xenorhabdus poinarii G6]|uniref:Arc-like DNA binding domain-containing protein n=1 Tax=Xenorhabdus poinarii G6 TaxID=1354304 RepID=A0A068R0J3_9GAMM|nr:Arc family DNA-binding protein [Xenorhabdus poinarii]CDG20698.1 protein of unknown function [Xenorhabdus poinarii G6]